jgi:hypothetical protein
MKPKVPETGRVIRLDSPMERDEMERDEIDN